MLVRNIMATAALLAASAALVTAGAQEQDNLAFGGPEDTAYADALWQSLVDAKLAGENAIQVRPYEGTEPHGFALATIYSDLGVNGRTGQEVGARFPSSQVAAIASRMSCTVSFGRSHIGKCPQLENQCSLAEGNAS